MRREGHHGHILDIPGEIRENGDSVCASWRRGDGIPTPHVTAMLRSAVIKNGRNPASFSLHFPRAGGATALYRATKDIDRAERFGR